ncbi:hypothetical protein BAE44_0021607 [Dichanthelium oligosanthes]|uniref:Uncharacterized protein n=1 Tax=Dichanthelium oligosanthes TaxID=888268 RepID=A0A1E5UX44_9POAL|nr:hypothetical protein BAE44_0021607 [Dichanthelium oligosanthes]
MVVTPLNSFAPYWYSGKWNGQYFNSVPEVSRSKAKRTFVDNAHEKHSFGVKALKIGYLSTPNPRLNVMFMQSVDLSQLAMMKSLHIALV